MLGLRIAHVDPVVKGCIYRVLGGRKPLHIHVAGDGTSVVSVGVWADLELARRNTGVTEFELVNTTKHPPHLLIGMGTDPVEKPAKQLIERAMRDIAPIGTTVTIKR